MEAEEILRDLHSEQLGEWDRLRFDAGFERDGVVVRLGRARAELDAVDCEFSRQQARVYG